MQVGSPHQHLFLDLSVPFAAISSLGLDTVLLPLVLLASDLPNSAGSWAGTAPVPESGSWVGTRKLGFHCEGSFCEAQLCR